MAYLTLSNGAIFEGRRIGTPVDRSNGPGDPKENDSCIAEIRKMLGIKPMMGICLGHQLIALSLGGDTVKLKYGHRGGNQPVKDVSTGRSFITSQNHGYAVVACSLRGIGQEVFINLNFRFASSIIIIAG